MTNGGIETIDYIRSTLTKEEFTGYCIGNVLKYASRWHKKGGIEDLKKAQTYLKWAVDGCLLWQREGLKQPAAVLQATAEYKSEMDVISAFIDDCIEVTDSREYSTDVFKVYARWARDNNEYEMKSTKFGIEFSKRYEKSRDNKGIYYKQIKLKNEYKEYGISIVGK